MKTNWRLFGLICLLMLSLLSFISVFFRNKLPMQAMPPEKLDLGGQSITYLCFPAVRSSPAWLRISRMGSNVRVSKDASNGWQVGQMDIETWEKLWKVFSEVGFLHLQDTTVNSTATEYSLSIWDYESVKHNHIIFDESALRSNGNCQLLYTTLWNALETVDLKPE